MFDEILVYGLKNPKKDQWGKQYAAQVLSRREIV